MAIPLHRERNSTTATVYEFENKGRNDSIATFKDEKVKERPDSTKQPTDHVDLSAVMNRHEIGTIIIDNEYGTYKVALISKDEEIGRVVQMYKKVATIFGAFATIGFASTVTIIALGISGSLSPFLTLLGSFLTGILTVGVYFDYKKWERNHA